MYWAESTQEFIHTLKPVKPDPALIKRILSVVDLTSLNATDTESSLASFFEKAQTPFGHVAAVCVYPTFLRLAAAEFAKSPVKVATVVNFPEGEASLESVLIDIGSALQNGAQEMDVVFPYRRYLAGERKSAQQFVTACKAACGEVTLKVILETGAMKDLEMIADASLDVLMAGADFIKTSTGKINVGASLEAAAIMLLVIREVSPKLRRQVGIKISGGVREIQQAVQYLQLADNIMGRDWTTPSTFRIGASKLVDEMICRVD